MNLKGYDYVLPDGSLALKPANPRDASRFLIYDTAKDSIVFDHFYNIDRYLSSDSFFVMNNTKVIPARVAMKKETGGKVKVLFLVNEIKKNVCPALVDRKVEVGNKLFFDGKEYVEVVGQKEHMFDLKFKVTRKKLFGLLKEYGSMPIPPYLKRTPLKRNELLDKYQTVFAKFEGSSAAPTASLHFTDRVFEKLEKKGVKKYFVTLHVGLGTFAPLTKDNLKTKKLHEEHYEVDKKTWQSIKTSRGKGKKLVAIGTTTVRTLESAVQNGKTTGKTDLFIYPPFDFKIVDGLITNFHLPKSSLMMLVQAFLRHKKAKKHLVELYNEAIKNGLRFFSFGDAMLII